MMTFIGWLEEAPRVLYFEWGFGAFKNVMLNKTN